MGYYRNAMSRNAIKTTRDKPAPSAKPRGVNKGFTDILKTLKVGESVWLPTSFGSAYSLANALRVRSEHNDWRFTIRKEKMPSETAAELGAGEDNQDGARVWRVE